MLNVVTALLMKSLTCSNLAPLIFCELSRMNAVSTYALSKWAWDIHQKYLVYICLQENVKWISISLDKSKSKYVAMNVITGLKCQNG